MRNVFVLAMLALLALGLTSCGGTQKGLDAGTGNIPEWFNNVPEDPDHFYASATSVSRDLQLAIDKAETSARQKIATQLETKINGMQKQFQEEVGFGDDAELLQQFTSVTKQVTSTSLMGSRIKKQQTHQDGSNWRAYILMEYPIGAASEALMAQLKQQNNLYTRFRSSQAFDELDKEVQKYEDWKKEQQSGGTVEKAQ